MEIAFKIRKDLITNFNFVRLTTMLVPGNTGVGIFNPSVHASIKAMEEFINQADEKMFIEKGPTLLNILDNIIKVSLKNFPPKKDLAEISLAYNQLLNSDNSIFSYGIPFGWLDTFIDTSNFFNSDIPYQARIGTGFHAGNWSLEEMFLLDDGFFFLLCAEIELETLNDIKDKIIESENKGYPDENIYYEARAINLNTCSYARNSIVNLYSFIECFVNSIGYDFFLRNETRLSEDEKELLQGRKKSNYVSLEYKVEKFHQLIRTDHKQVLCISDLKQIREPFKTFFTEYKEIRDAAMHYSPNKKSIWIKPTDWVAKAQNNSQLVIEVANEIWKSCYPDKEPPFYLRDLSFQKCYDAAKERINDTNKTKSNSGHQPLTT
jgi:hypothetical protein